jgi:predicted RNA-binding Zn-ribbon protein involved in translation (DUF1610 family)
MEHPMPDTATPPEADVIAVRRAIAQKHPTATGTEAHMHEGAFLGITFRTGERYYWWADPTGAMPEQPRYAREHAAAVLLPRAERAAARIVPSALWTRGGEEQVSVLQPDVGDCPDCGKQLTRAMFRWTNRTPDPDPFENELFSGDGRFPSLRHADGSPDHDGPFGPSSKPAHPACPDCLRTGLTYDDTGYGTTARCPHCGWHKYTDRGD